MKFKSIFILFCVILLLFFALLVFLPYLILGAEFSASFWRDNWPLLGLWLFVFLAFVAFYAANQKLFKLLEKEDWPALSRYLEEKVLQKGNFSPRLVRLLANTYLVLSDSLAVMSLENKLAIAKPALVEENALVFGTARILGKDISGAARFFGTRKDTVKNKIKEWVRWYYGFSLLLDSRFEDAGEEFSFLARFSRDAVIAGLSSYFLSQNIARMTPEKSGEYLEVSSVGRDRVRKILPAVAGWTREVERLSTEIHAAAISKYLEETGRWIYSR